MAHSGCRYVRSYSIRLPAAAIGHPVLRPYYQTGTTSPFPGTGGRSSFWCTVLPCSTPRRPYLSRAMSSTRTHGISAIRLYSLQTALSGWLYRFSRAFVRWTTTARLPEIPCITDGMSSRYSQLCGTALLRLPLENTLPLKRVDDSRGRGEHCIAHTSCPGNSCNLHVVLTTALDCHNATPGGLD